MECNLFATVDYRNGDGIFRGYVTFTFADGAQLVTDILGRADQGADGSSALSAVLDIVDGTGRYAGATGSGTWVAERSGPVGTPVEGAFVLTLDG